MSELPRSRTEIVSLLERAMTDAGDEMAELDDEHLALLAEGRGAEIPTAAREALLRRAAADPQIGRLVADLCALNLGGVSSADEARRLRFAGAIRTVAVGWAVAACLVIGLAGWRWAQPPAPAERGGSFQTYSAEDVGPDYWSEAARQRRQERAARDRYRDYALAAAVAGCAVLSVGLVVCLAGARRRRAAPPSPES